jgi:hypothetical protein
MTVWLALTDAPGAMEFAVGTSRAKTRREMAAACQLYSGPAHTPTLNNYNQACLEQKQLERGYANGTGFVAPDMRAGDVLVFNGQQIHRGIATSSPRLAVSLRLQWRRGTGAGLPAISNHDHSSTSVIPWIRYSSAKSDLRSMVCHSNEVGKLNPVALPARYGYWACMGMVLVSQSVNCSQ